jgi:hypothetical protein
VQEVGFTWPSSVVITVSLEANDAQQTDILTRVKEFGLSRGVTRFSDANNSGK